MTEEGWTWLANSPKWHYFRDGRSLCRRWMLFGSGHDYATEENLTSPDNCKACAGERAKEINKQALESAKEAT